MQEIPRLGDWETYQSQIEQAVADNDPIALLLADHEWLRSIIIETDNRFRAGAPIDTPNLRRIQTTIWGHINSHIHKEEDAVFPALDILFIANGIDVETVEMYGEHDAIRIRYDRLQDALDTNDDPSDEFRHLWKALVVHFDNEEQRIFDNARPVMTPEVGRDLTARLTSGEFAPVAAEEREPG